MKTVKTPDHWKSLLRTGTFMAVLLLIVGCGSKQEDAPAIETTAQASSEPRNQVERAQQQLDATVEQAQNRLEQSLKELDEQTR